MKWIPLRARDGSIRAHTSVDDADYAVIGGWRWSLHRSGYVVRTIDGRQTSLHRHLLGLKPGEPGEVDHIDGDRLNNQRSNLRIVTRAQNGQNLRPHPGASRFRGVARMRDGWRATVKLDGRTHFLGLFPTEAAAAEAASAFRAEHMPFSADARAAA